jgi:hypothetical protein
MESTRNNNEKSNDIPEKNFRCVKKKRQVTHHSELLHWQSDTNPSLSLNTAS